VPFAILFLFFFFPPSLYLPLFSLLFELLIVTFLSLFCFFFWMITFTFFLTSIFLRYPVAQLSVQWSESRLDLSLITPDFFLAFLFFCHSSLFSTFSRLLFALSSLQGGDVCSFSVAGLSKVLYPSPPFAREFPSFCIHCRYRVSVVLFFKSNLNEFFPQNLPPPPTLFFCVDGSFPVLIESPRSFFSSSFFRI